MQGVAVQVRILGTLQVVVDGQPDRIPGAAERELLARLATDPGRVLSTDRLIDDLWGEHLPVDAANALQVRVSKLRRALAQAGGASGTVVTRPPGYLLQVVPEDVDAQRFSKLVAEARRSADRGAQAAAASAYDESLALWRGPALAGFTTAWAVTEAARLEELRLVAVEDRNDVALAMGRHAELVADLEALVAAHPLRERLRAQLMLALYRAGRQADALAAYAAARASFAEELGILPGEELQQLERAVLRQDPGLAAPRREVATATIDLPRRRTSFVGRQAELERLTAMLAERRLVTLVGPGGAGKTTLALEAARASQPRFVDGGAFVALSGVGDASMVPQAVAEALDIPAGAAAATSQRLVSALAAQEVLLILDNCEHLVDAVAELVEDLLDACHQMRVLTTSREPLGIDGETQLEVAPLPLPAAADAVAELATNPAVQLFVDRAGAVAATFGLTDANARVVARICTALDGMPLALELAAARVRMLPVEEIADRLDDRFELLTSGRRTAEARHQTLRAAVDWSYELLTTSEQRLFRRLAVFRGGWTLDAAEEVCCGGGIDPRAVTDLLGRLVDRSLVVANRSTGRFRMLDTLRHYAAERLTETGEEAGVRSRHVRWCLELAERSEVQLRGAQQAVWLDRLRTERDNLHQALTWCLEHATELAEEGTRLVGALGWWWYLGRQEDGQVWIERILGAVAEVPPRSRALAHGAGALVWRPGACVVHPSARCAEEAAAARDAAEEAGDERLAAYARTLLAVEAVGAGDLADADADLDDAGRSFADLDEPWGQGLVAFVRSEIAFHRATLPFADALGLSEAAARIFTDLGDDWGRSAVLAHQAHALERNGRISEALAVGEVVLGIARRLGLSTTLQWMTAQTGFCLLALGDLDGARARFTEAAEIATAVGGGPGAPYSQLGQASLARERGELADALRLYGAAADGCRTQGMRHYEAAALLGVADVDRRLGDIVAGSGACEQALRMGTATRDAGIRAGALEVLAALAADAGDGERAAALLGAADRIRREGLWTATPLERRDIERIAATARAVMRPDEFDRAFVAGVVQVHPDLHVEAAPTA
jgi:predicted ATPase/DNA-binding SARP family transcriptional activator/tetratricopeptide (TPR) repeat protein